MAAVASPFPSLLQPPIAFARLGDGASTPVDALAWFRNALDQGAAGLACEVHLSGDGQAMVHDGPVLRSGIRRQRLSALPAARIPPSVPSLAQVYERCGSRFHLAVTLADDVAADVVAGMAREAGGGADERLWLCSPDWRQAASWRTRSRSARLVQVTRLRAFEEGPERRAATLSAAGIDAISLRETDWNAGLTTLFHRFGLLSLTGPTPHRHRLDAVLAAGVDAVTSAEVDEMVSAVAAVARSG
jgi:glycerophosphoryl diester phosphodiesterase